MLSCTHFLITLSRRIIVLSSLDETAMAFVCVETLGGASWTYEGHCCMQEVTNPDRKLS